MRREDLSEKQWQAVLVEGLDRHGWTTMHVRRARVPTKGGGARWLTPTSQPGWPDLIAVRNGHLAAIEVKARRTPVDPEQIAWLTLLAGMPNGHGWLLRPTVDWSMVARWLSAPTIAPAVYGFDESKVPNPAAFLASAASKRRAARSKGGSTGERGGSTPSLDDPTGQLLML